MNDFNFSPQRASYASHAARSRGRLLEEPASATRTEFQRDRDRIIHSAAFRRLAHKTQVFVPHEGDHFRTRLTHSIEVGQIARAIARALGLDDDLAEALALAHDLGHTPFGHTGEDVLDDLMLPYGGFDHNAQALRIVTKLERRYAAFDGLNLTWETLEGLVKHNGPLLKQDGTPIPRYAEAQAAALADDIAYNAHDIDDGLRAEILDFQQISETDFLRDIGSEIEAFHPGLEKQRIIHELVRRLITHFIEDAIAESKHRLSEARIESVEQIRERAEPVVAFTEATHSVDRLIKSFLFEHMYRHPDITRIRADANEVIVNLFRSFFAETELMPKEWAQTAAGLGRKDEARRARLVCDYIAGMTDRFALAEHKRLFDVAPELR